MVITGLDVRSEVETRRAAQDHRTVSGPGQPSARWEAAVGAVRPAGRTMRSVTLDEEMSAAEELPSPNK